MCNLLDEARSEDLVFFIFPRVSPKVEKRRRLMDGREKHTEIAGQRFPVVMISTGVQHGLHLTPLGRADFPQTRVLSNC